MTQNTLLLPCELLMISRLWRWNIPSDSRCSISQRAQLVLLNVSLESRMPPEWLIIGNQREGSWESAFLNRPVCLSTAADEFSFISTRTLYRKQKNLFGKLEWLESPKCKTKQKAHLKDATPQIAAKSSTMMGI